MIWGSIPHNTTSDFLGITPQDSPSPENEAESLVGRLLNPAEKLNF